MIASSRSIKIQIQLYRNLSLHVCSWHPSHEHVEVYGQQKSLKSLELHDCKRNLHLCSGGEDVTPTGIAHTTDGSGYGSKESEVADGD